MKKNLRVEFRLLLLGIAMCCGLGSAWAQVTTTIYATGTPGSYATGSVNSGGTKNDGLMVGITQTTNRGWAVFDLSSIPPGSTVSAVTLKFTTTSNTVLSTATNFIGGFAWSSANDPATVAGGTLYTLLNANASSNLNSSSWTANALQTKALNAAGVTFIVNNLGGKVVISFVRGSTNNYEIYGYGATSSQQPQLEITYVPSTPCAGQPSVATATAPANVCAGSSFALNATGYTVGAGISFDWQYYDNATGSWLSTGGTNPSYTAAGITTATDYRFVTTCANGGGQDISNTVSVGINPFYNCYCTPASTCTNEGIENVSFATLNNASTFCNLATGYTDYGGLGSLANVIQGQQVLTTVTAHINSNPASAAVWIDYDHNGTFDASEFTSLGNATVTIPSGGTSYSFTGTVNIPATAMTGTTRMRVRSANQGGITATSACTNSGVYGEYEDYLITIDPAPNCSGQPDPVTISAVATAVCPTIPFTLSATGVTVGTGITYSWEMFDGSSWVAIPGASTLTYTESAGITSPTDYRFVTICSNGGGQDISNTVSMTVNPVTSCYCIPTGTSSGYGIQSFSTTGAILNITNLNSGTSSGGYGNFTSMTVGAPAASIINFSTSFVTGTNGFAIFVDWDQDGSFAQTGDLVYNTTSYASSPLTGSFTIPATAATGQTRMRIVSNWLNSNPSSEYCAANNSGIYAEWEDYTMDVIVLTGCSGQPDPTTITGPGSVCSGTDFTLTATGMTIGNGITYDWQVDDGSGWVSTGVSTPTYTITGGISAPASYQFVTTCANGGGQDISNVLSVTINPVTQCYCIPTYANGGANDYISNVVLGTLTNNTNAAGNPSAHYTDFTSQQPGSLAIPDLEQGLFYTLSVSFGPDASQYSMVWIDFNQDGIFDASESFTTGANAGGSGTANISITVPATAMTGHTRMRIRGADDSQPTGAQACGASNSTYGEAEDYLVNITPSIPCSGQPNLTTITGPASVCMGVDFTLTATGMTTGGGITYDWQVDDGSGWVSTGVSIPTYTVTGGISAPASYQFVTTCANGGGQDISNTLSLTINAPNTCYCIPVGSSTSYRIGNFSTTGGVTDISNLSSGYSAGGYGDFTSMVLNATPGSTINFNSSDFNGTVGFALWIDWDADGNFSSPGDLVYNTTGYVSSVSGSFTVPVTAVAGATRMRIIANGLGSNPSTQYCSDPTYNGAYAEWEDYTIIIGAPPTCIPPTPLFATTTSTSSADVSWTAVGNAVGYEWAVDNSSTLAPNAATTVNTTTSTGPISVSSLNSGMTYYLHVRTDCGGGDYSSWSVKQFVITLVNDDYCGAIDLVVDDPAISFVNTTAATTSAADPQDFNSCTSANNNVWYKFTTGAAGIYYVNSYAPPTGSNNMSAWMWLYTVSGTCPGTLAFTLVQDMTNCSVAVPAASPVPAGAVSSTATVSLAAGTTYYLFVDGNSGSYGDIGFNVTSNPLNVKLTSITATNVGSRNRVDWITASEDRGDYFEVERSVDGSNFTKIGTVNGKGTGANYSFWDNTPVNGVNYYRLKMMEQSGSYQYSNTVKATVKDVNAFSVEAFPNPVTENSVTVKVYGTSGANATVSLSDITGKVIKVVSVNANTVTIDMRGLAAGVYLIKYADDAHSQTIKINKN